MDAIKAGGGLRLSIDETGQARLFWGKGDWLGPLSFAFGGKAMGVALEETRTDKDGYGAYTQYEADGLPVRPGIRAYTDEPLLVFTLTADEHMNFGPGTGLAQARAAWPHADLGARFDGAFIERLRVFGYQLCEFAYPLFSGGAFQDFSYYLDRPRAALPLILHHEDGRCLILSPLNAFHDQTIGLPEENDGNLACGWHGDLARVQKGFATAFAVYAGLGVRQTLEDFGALLQKIHGTKRPSRYADDGVGRLSYWTDNGAAYWYRSEDGEPIHDTLIRVQKDLMERKIPVKAYQLDSWFYQHERPRGLNPSGEDIVPPSGMMLWEAREDMLPKGVDGLAGALGHPPLILHSRHFSKASPYFRNIPAWSDSEYAHPRTAALFDRLLGQAKEWGAITYEQDWLSEAYLFVSGLREEPGRADRWQSGLDEVAGRHGITLQWCMATPMDFLHTVKLENVTSIRTSNDYRYQAGNNEVWVWFLFVNALARALGLNPFKDVFFSSPEGEGIDGDPHAEAEALLSALSSGPVGIGDRLGRCNPDIVMRTCRRDGILLKPDVPIAPVDGNFGPVHPVKDDQPVVAECHSLHEAGRWHYLAAFNVSLTRQPVTTKMAVGAWMQGRQRHVAYDWRQGTITPLDEETLLQADLGGMGWAYWVLAPVTKSGIALLGEPAKYAMAADKRFAFIKAQADGVAVSLNGAPGEKVTLLAWSEKSCRVEAMAPDVTLSQDADGRIEVACVIPAAGRLDIALVTTG